MGQNSQGLFLFFGNAIWGLCRYNFLFGFFWVGHSILGLFKDYLVFLVSRLVQCKSKMRFFLFFQMAMYKREVVVFSLLFGYPMRCQLKEIDFISDFNTKETGRTSRGNFDGKVKRKSRF